VDDVRTDYPYTEEPEGGITFGNLHVAATPRYPPSCYRGLAGWLGSGNVEIDGNLTVRGRILTGGDQLDVNDLIQTVVELKSTVKVLLLSQEK
jgi:hypothetical protein